MTRASTTLIWFTLTLFISLALYHTSYRVEDLDQQLSALNREIENEQRTLHVLKAEWVFLSNPARIEAAAKKYLDLRPTDPQQVTSSNKLAVVLPSHAEKMAKARMENREQLAQNRSHPAAAKPQVVAEEAGRLNTHLVIGQTAQADLPTASPYYKPDSQELALAIAGHVP